MKRPSHVQRDAFHRAGGSCCSGHPLAGITAARHNNVAGAENVGHFEHTVATGLIADSSDLVAIQPQDCHHATGIGLSTRLHRPSPNINHPDSRFKIEPAGMNERRVFSQRQTSGCRLATITRQRTLRPRPQQFEHRQACYENCWLADRGRAQPLSGSLATNLQQIVAEHR